ncbi:MAG: hypothetical protein R3215_00165 [Halomonas sp.]|nr:hypothetical protein [Halomonas sp.]
MNFTRGLCCALLGLFAWLGGYGHAMDMAPEWFGLLIAMALYFAAGSGS